jgi:hypothetical protein
MLCWYRGLGVFAVAGGYRSTSRACSGFADVFRTATPEFGETGEQARTARKLVSQSSASTQISPVVKGDFVMQEETVDHLKSLAKNASGVLVPQHRPVDQGRGDPFPAYRIGAA